MDDRSLERLAAYVDGALTAAERREVERRIAQDPRYSAFYDELLAARREADRGGSTRRRLPATVWLLGIVSLLMDTSGEAIQSLMPLFLTGTLGASALWVGLIDGLGRGTALATRWWSGSWSDGIARRAPLVLAGYGLGALSRPLIAFAPGAAAVLGIRLLDRVGKGIRGAPRDALIADVTPEERRGAAYGLRQSLDTLGAAVGPLVAIGLMAWSDDDVRQVFWIASLPGLAAFGLLLAGLREPRRRTARRPKLRPRRADWRDLGQGFRAVTTVGALLMLARFGEAFAILRAIEAGVAPRFVPAVLIVIMGCFSLLSYPVGRLADRLDRRLLIAGACLTLGLAHAIWATPTGAEAFWIGAVAWGVHLGLSQGVLSAQLASVVSPERRGAAFGWFGLISGVTAALASFVAGAGWVALGPSGTFQIGLGLCAVATAALVSNWRRLPA